MKSGTQYAARFKKAFTRHRQSTPAPDVPERTDPLRQLAVAVLAVAGSEDEAERAIDRLLKAMVDWNEIRVSTVSEIERALGSVSAKQAQQAGTLLRALRSVFDSENCMSLDRLQGLGRREARQVLEKLDGVDEYAVASVLLYGLGGHAIPVSDRMLETLRQADLVHPTATRAEVQAFLERHVSAAQAKEFCVLMRSFRPDKPATTSGKKKRSAGAAKGGKKRSSPKRAAS